MKTLSSLEKIFLFIGIGCINFFLSSTSTLKAASTPDTIINGGQYWTNVTLYKEDALGRLIQDPQHPESYLKSRFWINFGTTSANSLAFTPPDPDAIPEQTDLSIPFKLTWILNRNIWSVSFFTPDGGKEYSVIADIFPQDTSYVKWSSDKYDHVNMLCPFQAQIAGPTQLRITSSKKPDYSGPFEESDEISYTMTIFVLDNSDKIPPKKLKKMDQPSVTSSSSGTSSDSSKEN